MHWKTNIFENIFLFTISQCTDSSNLYTYNLIECPGWKSLLLVFCYYKMPLNLYISKGLLENLLQWCSEREETRLRRFYVCLVLVEMFSLYFGRTHATKISPKHLLWSLLFLKCYCTATNVLTYRRAKRLGDLALEIQTDLILYHVGIPCCALEETR